MSRPPTSEGGWPHAATVDDADPPSGGWTERLNDWMTPGIRIKRWILLLMVASVLGAFSLLAFFWMSPLRAVMSSFIYRAQLWLLESISSPWLVALALVVLAAAAAIYGIVQINRTLLWAAGMEPKHVARAMSGQHTLSREPRIVAVGGGTGLSNLLRGLKEHSSNLTAVVTVADDGGSSGQLRQSLNMIAPGDLTDCYAALSKHPALSQLLLHRFGRGEGLEGHTFGNLLLATLSEERGGLAPALGDLHEILRMQGKVYPATTEPTTLVARLSDGRTVRGESRLASELGGATVREVLLDPQELPAVPEVIHAIEEADLIVLGPGSLFTSILPVLLVPEVGEALRNTSAPILYVASLMTEPGETERLSLEDHFSVISGHLGRAPDWILLNSQPLPLAVVQHYAQQRAEPLVRSAGGRNLRSRYRYAPLLDQAASPLANHHSALLAQAILQLLEH
ncbi:gluconeogenesis factor YvcK family protein [Deinococcus radiophilus]|uniref:gluconeogenesis factor YvcK family protein n=1 Tax=Deinococcus radiophilus TaxID=32062 RepID=UPI001E63CEB6|nr:uridine diphosphate-N-acetylglucosamine-binding protein YvcK [Deinococcus radiophilus]UFA51076.1 uridine diphosphate-N-acetylglucosamine-binding protein YvcK [Deinococcus radiophilus]